MSRWRLSGVRPTHQCEPSPYPERLAFIRCGYFQNSPGADHLRAGISIIEERRQAVPGWFGQEREQPHPQVMNQGRDDELVSRRQGKQGHQQQPQAILWRSRPRRSWPGKPEATSDRGPTKPGPFAVQKE